MKINSFQAENLYKSYLKKGDSSANTSKGTEELKTGRNADRVEISKTGSDINRASVLTKNSIQKENSEDRQSRISKIKQQIDSGEYNVSSEDVARSILGGKIDKRA